MCRNQHLLILIILRIWNVRMSKSFDFMDFNDLACADTKIFRFQRFLRFGMCRGQRHCILMILRTWYVQKPKSLDFKDCKDLGCAEAHAFGF